MASEKKPKDWEQMGSIMKAARQRYLQEIAKETANSPQKSPQTMNVKKQQEITAKTIQDVKASTSLTSSEERMVHTSLVDFQKNLSNDLQRPAVGIDLGTTYSSIAVYENQRKRVTIIPNELGLKTTPSYVAVDEAGYMITGNYAKSLFTNINPAYRIFDAKRLIGRSYDDPIVQEDIKLWPFVVVNHNNSPKIQVKDRTLYPEQISAQVLLNLKKYAEEYLQLQVTRCVITVPAYFNDSQRQATKDAGTIAGLEVLRIINEPTAAAIAYTHQINLEERKNIIIFDLGGGTFDLSILSMDANKIEVRGVGGDTHLGGQDFDNKMVDHCIKTFRAKTGIDLIRAKVSPDLLIRSKAAGSLQRLKNECETQKQCLSAAKSVNVVLEAFFEGHNLHVTFTRELFNSLNATNFQRCINIMDTVLREAKLEKTEIDDIVMVGGSSKIPLLREMVTTFFGLPQPLRQPVNAEEAVVYGAALQAALMSSVEIEKKFQNGMFEPEFHDVTPLDLGIRVFVDEGEEEQNDFYAIIPRNSRVPCLRKKRLATPMDYCEALDISIYDGVEKSIAGNHLLGQFILSNLPRDALEGELIDVSMEVSKEGILHVWAEAVNDKAAKNEIVVNKLSSGLKREDVQRLQMEPMEELFLTMS